jgi:Restriction endonuclease
MDEIEDEEQLKKIVTTLLVRGKNPDGEAIYAYVSVRANLVKKFLEAQKMETFYPEDYGTIIETDMGEPSAEVRAYMELEYGFDHHSMVTLDTNGGAMGKILEKIGFTNNLSIQLTEINAEFCAHIAKRPDLIYEFTPRKFEELIANILNDMGYEVELTPQTRDGGRDILAVLQTPLGKMLTIVECKRYSPERKIGLDIVERFFHVIDRKDNASSGLIATTSFFSSDAKNMARQFDYRLKLCDFDGIKNWIGRYGKWQQNSDNLLWCPELR